MQRHRASSFGKRKRRVTKMHQSFQNGTSDEPRPSIVRLERHTRIFASMCPDEILDHYDDYETRMYQTTLMLGDVSDLTEKYTKAGKGGPSKLTETLNSYIGAMVQEILSHNGDVLKFSGDAFIVMWKLRDGEVIRDLAVEAMQTACIIQKHFGTYETDVGVTLRVKLAIASGKTYFTSIGDPDTMSYYIITGKPVWDVKFAEGLCRGGDILVAPSSWQWVNPNEYVYQTLPDGVHTLIIACSSMWNESKGQRLTDTSTTDDDTVDDDDDYDEDDDDLDSNVESTAKRRVSSVAPVSEWESDAKTRTESISLTGDLLQTDAFQQVDYSLRPKVTKIAKERAKDSLRSYMLRPVVRSVEMDEPLEYLTEMRQVVILFINVITTLVGKNRLIVLVNDAYKLVCGIVGEMHGCVNKTSLFDKDLMFLCIFGLRGDKHELESQIGLRCAYRVRQELTAMQNIRSVTIGVTSGMTYCGVVGHVLRREYTVVGLAVNKAARLMCAYSDKVICDRESFLQSRLEARYFTLQEPKILKGITNAGPVYEFQEKDKLKVSELVWSKYPLLGREEEMQTFRQLLTALLEHSNRERTSSDPPLHQNTLIILSEPRMGKSRLLDEMAQNVPSGVPCNYISLVSSDAKAPYMLTQLIFSTVLGFNAASTPKERENRLVSMLGRVRQPHYLCALNQPFNVRFKVSWQYKSLDEADRHRVLRKFLLKLVAGCFRECWVVIVDDAEYADDESLELYDTMTRRDTVLFVMGIGRKLSADYKIHHSLLRRAQIIELTGIDKWYHAGLACQILNVNGVPANLEKLIQERSSGNPGWIESYLLSLVQAGGLVILNVTKKEAEMMGYVLPPVVMLKRFSPTAATTDAASSAGRTDRWRMYRGSFRDSQLSLHEAPASKPEIRVDDAESTIAICKIPMNFRLEDVDAQVTMDAMILKLFDSLTPLDQLLLKCASVLGETVNRKMLESLMETTSRKEIGIAVTKLFEIRVFSCAVGDFVRNPEPVVFQRNARDPTVDAEIICACTGVVVAEELAGMPKYASCGLMRFKMRMFHATTYGLLTENQKMELHSKALKYLQQHTRRCVACGEGQFAKLLGKTTVQEEKKRAPTDIEYLLESYEFGELGEQQTVATKSDDNVAKKGKDWSCLNVCRKVERKSTSTFSNVDFANCQCNLILTTVYTQMLDHCRGIGKNDMTLTAILEYVEVCLASCNIPQARRLLSDGEDLLSRMFDTSEEQLIVLPYLTSKIETFRGRCYLECGQISEAESSLKRAMKSLGYSFPTLDLVIELKSTMQLELLKMTLKCLRGWKMGTVEGQLANYTEQLASSLAYMFDVFRARGMKKHARLAAIWGLNAALASNKDFFVLCTCYANMLITAHVYRNQSIVPALEDEGIVLCGERSESLESRDLKMIVELYAAIFFSRWSRGQIHGAIRLGFVGVRLAQTSGSVFFKLIMLPKLIHLLMISCRLAEMVSLLRELEFVSRDDMDSSGRTWYYALCADAHLDTGAKVLTFRSCERYYLREGEAMISLRDPEAQRRYFTSMWLWCVRTEQWEASKIWSNRIDLPPSIMDEHEVAATITALKNLEGLLILYVHRLNGRSAQADATFAEIRRAFKTVKRMIRISKIVVPRYHLMKAYYHAILSRKGAAMRLLRRVQRMALKDDNKMIFYWSRHCEKAWSDSMNQVQADLWNDRSKRAVSRHWEEVNANNSNIVLFTLPLPKYSN